MVMSYAHLKLAVRRCFAFFQVLAMFLSISLILFVLFNKVCVLPKGCSLHVHQKSVFPDSIGSIYRIAGNFG